MIEEMYVLYFQGTRELVPLPLNKSIVGFHRVYAINVGFDGKDDHLKND